MKKNKLLLSMASLVLSACAVQPPADVVEGDTGGTIRTHAERAADFKSGRFTVDKTAPLPEIPTPTTVRAPAENVADQPLVEAEDLDAPKGVKSADAARAVAVPASPTLAVAKKVVLSKGSSVSADLPPSKVVKQSSQPLDVAKGEQDQATLKLTRSFDAVTSRATATKRGKPVRAVRVASQAPVTEERASDEKADVQASLPKTKKLQSAEPAASVKEPQRAVRKKSKEIEAVEEVSYTEHEVKKGENLFRIGLMYHVSPLDIMAANDFETPHDLKSGTKIRVPVRGASHAVKEEASAKPTALVKSTKGKKLSKQESAQVAAKPLTKLTDRVAKKAAASRPSSSLASEDASSVRTAEEAAVEDGASTTAASSAEETEAPAAAKPKVSSKDAEAVSDETTPAKQEVADDTLDDAPVVKPVSGNGLIWPVEGGKIVRGFGQQGVGVNNTGINILLKEKAPVYAVEDGVVLYADKTLAAYGNMILLRHSNGMITAYAHNFVNKVKRGDKVKKGQRIALAGKTGNVDKVQLHFEVRRNAQAINPLSVLPSRG